MEKFDEDDSIKVILLAGTERACTPAPTSATWPKPQSATWPNVTSSPNGNGSSESRSRSSPLSVDSHSEVDANPMMHCDVIICSETARIGQPEINIGVMPGPVEHSGPQFRHRQGGRHGCRPFGPLPVRPGGALGYGLVSRVVPKEHWYREALNVAQAMAAKPAIALRYAKESVLKADELPLSQGLEYERKLFYMLFDTDDQKEGMSAFIEKRKPSFTGK